MKKIKAFLKYLVALAVAGWLLWLVYHDQDVEGMLARLKFVEYEWLVYSVALALVSHVFRAYRWNILLKPMGYELKTGRTFLAVMVGYFVNLLLPRAGEVSRCGLLKRTDNVNLTASIGTVVAERAIDFLFLISVVALAFVVEFDLLSGYLSGVFGGNLSLISRNLLLIYILLGAGIVLFVITFLYLRHHKERLKRSKLFLQFRMLLRELVEGLTSLKKADNKLGFIISSVIIWATYYLMSYVVFFAIPETSELGLIAGLSILAMGSLGMIAPVQGGIGTYHALVAGVLVLYGIDEESSAFFAGLLHSAQTLMIVLVGGASFVISIFLKRRNAKADSVSDVAENQSG